MREPLVPVVRGAHEAAGRPPRRSPAPPCSLHDSATNARSPSRIVVRARARGPSKPSRRSVVERQLEVVALGPGDRLVVAVGRVVPVDLAAAVVEHRLAVEVDLDRAVDAAHRAQQHVVGVVVGRRAAVGVASARARGATGRSAARRGRSPSPSGCPTWSPGPSCPAGSGGRRARSGRRGRGGSRRRRGRASRRRPMARPCAAGTSTRRCRSARRARCTRSPTGRRTRRSAGTGCRPAGRRRRAGARSCDQLPRALERRQVGGVAQQRLADALAEDAGLAARGAEDRPLALGPPRTCA